MIKNDQIIPFAVLKQWHASVTRSSLADTLQNILNIITGNLTLKLHIKQRININMESYKNRSRVHLHWRQVDYIDDKSV